MRSAAGKKVRPWPSTSPAESAEGNDTGVLGRPPPPPYPYCPERWTRRRRLLHRRSSTLRPSEACLDRAKSCCVRARAADSLASLSCCRRLEWLPEVAVIRSSLDWSAAVDSACGCTWDPGFCGTTLPKDAELELVGELRRAEGVEGCGCDARVLEGIRARSAGSGGRQCSEGSG